MLLMSAPHQYGTDDVNQNGRRDLRKSRGTWNVKNINATNTQRGTSKTECFIDVYINYLSSP